MVQESKMWRWFE